MRTIISAPLSERPSDGGVCFCCRRRDDGIGTFLNGRPPRIVWACGDHITLIRKALSMPRHDYDFSENKAVEEAGNVAGAYLDKLGKTDLATLEKYEWLEFCRMLIDAFGSDLAKRIASHEAPF